LPAVPPARTMLSDSGRGNLDVPRAPAGAHIVRIFWGSLWGAGESKAEQKAEPGNHVGLKEVSSTTSQIYMLKEQVRLLQRHNEQLMNQTVPTQATPDTQDEDLALLKIQLAELKNRNAQLEDELSSQGSSRSATYHKRTPRVHRTMKASAVTPARKRSSFGVPTINLAAAAAQVARRRLLKKRSSIEDGKKCVDLTAVRPPGPRMPMSVRKSTMEFDGDEGQTDAGDDVCDLTGLRERQSLLGLPSRQ